MYLLICKDLCSPGHIKVIFLLTVQSCVRGVLASLPIGLSQSIQITTKKDWSMELACIAKHPMQLGLFSYPINLNRKLFTLHMESPLCVFHESPEVVNTGNHGF